MFLKFPEFLNYYNQLKALEEAEKRYLVAKYPQYQTSTRNRFFARLLHSTKHTEVIVWLKARSKLKGVIKNG